MTTGYSGYSDAKTANLGANTSEPKAPTGFQLKQMPEMYNDLAKLTFQFTRPTKTVLTLTEAVSDNEFYTVTIGTTNNSTHNANVTVINTLTDYTGSLTAGDIIQFGIATYKYIIKSITSTQITLTYGLATSISVLTDIKICIKTAESGTSSRSFRCNSTEGAEVYIYHEASNIINKWTVTTTLGTFLDKDKILATISETDRDFAKTRLYTSDTTPLAIKTSTVSLAGQKAVVFDNTITGIILPDDYISFGDDETFHQVDSITGATSILLKANLTTAISASTQVYKKKLLSDDATPVPYEFPDYQNTPLNEFTGDETLIDLWGYKLYMKTSTQTQGSLGTLVATFSKDNEYLINYTDGTSDYIFYAPDDSYNGREMYFALKAIDTEMPTANESLADMNAYLISLSTPVLISSVVLDTDLNEATITYGTVTGSGKNPHLLDVMNNNIAQYSTRGGFDIYKKAFTALDMGKGYYLAVDANNGKIIHPDILAGDFVLVRDTGSRHIWVGEATVNGSVDLNDTVKTYGDASISYLTAHSTINITAKRATIVKSTDSCLPLSSDATPVKQLLTEYSNTFTATELTANQEYLFVAESIDTEILYEKR
ncbi:MAG TPA: hypothetical protein PKI46_00565 [Bacteroidales bacterium]|nr:hypothetical protein [Bacteroidales bacterium]